MMKPFSSLFAKILFWFFLNLTLVATGLIVFVLFHSRMDLNVIFGRRMFDRMRVAERLISHDLNQTARENWCDVLTRHSEIHQVNFALVLMDGTQFLSKGMDFPADALKKVVGDFRPKPRPNDFPIPPGPPDREDPIDRPIDEAFGFRGPGGDGNRPPKPNDMRDEKPRLVIRTTDPTRYWARIPIPDPLTPSRPGPGPPSFCLLLAVSDSITGNGFFLDPFPWMIVAIAVLFISALLWIPLARNITRPIARMTRAAEEIAKGRFEVRIEEHRADEIGRLGSAINHMTMRLSGFIKGRKRFLGDVAHELGSPIARIQIGLGILEQRMDADNQQRVADVIEDVTHMSHLVNELLSFSKAEMEHPAPVRLTALKLLPLVREVLERERTPETQIITQIDPDTSVMASHELLVRALSNLVRNAVRYAGKTGPVFLKAERQRDQVLVEIKDSGPGVAEVLLDQIFEPFYRPEPSRDRDSGGVGLGLAIVKTCIEACDGTVSARNTPPTGLAITILLAKG
ncbi:MAG: HAMP domain-containing sensor histidine kinase [Pseudomonadota bacterium]